MGLAVKQTMALSARITRPRAAALAAIIALALGGCATDGRNAVPLELANKVQVVGIENIRGWGDAAIPNIQQLVDIRRRQLLTANPESIKRRRHRAYFLALSGGGSDGAFGAGFLNGWTASGKRPEFEIVAGVSTGALMAPFAFLGPGYDSRLRDIYTLHSTKDILQPQVLAGLLGGSALSSSKPMEQLISRYVDRKFLSEVAREHGKGRRLFIGTTNLDAERPVVWDMGRIAQRGSKRALRLFRKVMLASASIPGVFPPVFINVTSGGKTYQEMHVDGGTTDNAFLLPAHLDIRKLDRKNRVKVKRRLYVIVNSKTRPSPKIVKPSTMEIAGRSISTLIKQQTEGDLIKLYLRAKKNGIGFKLASVPPDFAMESKEAFDKEYMKSLYARGFDLAAKGYQWQKVPPGL